MEGIGNVRLYIRFTRWLFISIAAPPGFSRGSIASHRRQRAPHILFALALSLQGLQINGSRSRSQKRALYHLPAGMDWPARAVDILSRRDDIAQPAIRQT